MSTITQPNLTVIIPTNPPSARIFSGSFESAIYLLSMICSIPPTIDVLPAINSNFTHHISAGLANGTSIAGQVAISHPSQPTALPDSTLSSLIPPGHHLEAEAEDANLPGSLPVLRTQNITFSKSDEEDLPSRIDRLWGWRLARSRGRRG